MSITNPYPNPPTNIMNRGLVGSPVKSVGIQDFSPGWEKLIKSEEKKINNYLTYAKLGSIEGNLIKSSLCNNPTGGAWNASTVSHLLYLLCVTNLIILYHIKDVSTFLGQFILSFFVVIYG